MLINNEITELTDMDMAEVFSTVDYAKIANEYILAVKVETPDGEVFHFNAEEFKTFIEAPEMENGLFELALDFAKFKKDVADITYRIFND